MTHTGEPDAEVTYNRDTNDAKAWHTSTQMSVELGGVPDKDRPRRRDPVLDTPSEPNPLLTALMHHALLGIYLRSDGGTTRYEVAGKGRGKPNGSSTAPTSGLAYEIGELERDFTRARTHRIRLRVIKEAQAIGRRLAQAPHPSRIKGTKEWRRRLANDPRPRRAVAADFGVSSKTITAAKKEFGR